MKTLLAAFFCCSLIFLSGCSTLAVETDYDREIDFSHYKTFRWVVTKDKDDPLLSNPLVDKRIRSKVNAALASKGFRQSKETPDFFVAYHVTSKERVDYRDFDYGHWSDSYSNRTVDMRNYTESTVTLDFIDGKSYELAWRGWAMGPSSGVSESPERINQVVNEILERFPPASAANK